MSSQDEGKSYGLRLRFKSKKHQVGSISPSRRMFEVLRPSIKSYSTDLYVFATRCLQSLKLLLKLMSDSLRNASAPAPIYGFLCQQTNIFYAFETQEQYQEFLSWIQGSGQAEASAPTDDMVSEEELKYNFDRATENIMEVFEDPFFRNGDVQMELEEIDF